MNGIAFPAFRSAVAPFFRRIVRAVRDIIVKRAVARALSAMDDRTLKDLAISRGEIHHLAHLAARAIAENDGAAATEAGECVFLRFEPRQKASGADCLSLPLAA